MLPLLLEPCTEDMAKVTLQWYYYCPSEEAGAMEPYKWISAPVKACMVTFLLVEKATSSFTAGDLGV